MNPFDIGLQRDAIDDFKATRLNSLHRLGAYNLLDRETCVRAWVEQHADAELYEQRWHELGGDDE